MPETLTWLHLSDAHIGDPRHAPDAEHVLQTLAKDLSVMQNERGLRPDLVFFTGDAAFGDVPEVPLEQQYREVSRFLDGVRNAFRPHIDKSRVFLIPGNHDVNRSQATEDQEAWLEHLGDSGTAAEDKIDELIRKACVQWQRYMERLRSYTDFLRTYDYAHLLEDPKRLSYATRISSNGRSVGIVGLNTAWSCGEGTVKGNVWLGRWQLTTAYARVRDCDLRIVLSHHPFNWCTDREDPRIAREVARMFHYHLHGHDHDEWVIEDAMHTRIAGGACYDSMSKTNGYNFARVDLASGCTEVHLRGYDRQGHGWVPRCIHDRTTDRGIWTVRGGRAGTAVASGERAEAPQSTEAAERDHARPVDVYEYFSPASEIEDAEKFIGRRGELARAIGAMRSKGACVVIFGHAGLGKTSLAFQLAHVASGQHRDQLANLNLTHFVPPGGFNHPVIYYCCQRKDRTMEDVLTSVIRDSHPPFSTRALLKCKRVTAELDSPANADLAAQIDTIRMRSSDGEGGADESRQSEGRAVFAAFAATISKAFDGESLVVILDELNVVEDTSGLAALIKELHFVTFVLVGTAVDVRLLVRDHASVSRQLAEGLIRVKEMDPKDLKEIIRREEGRAREAFHFAAPAVLEIVGTASGMPYFVHLLGRYALSEALAAVHGAAPKCVVVSEEHVRRALSNSAEHMADLDAEYLELIRGSWQREFVLKLLASRDESDISLSNITPIARTQGIPAVRSQVSYLVRRRVLEQTSGTTLRFRDPRLRVFARFRPSVHDSNRRRLDFVRSQQERHTCPLPRAEVDPAPSEAMRVIRRRTGSA